MRSIQIGTGVPRSRAALSSPLTRRLVEFKLTNLMLSSEEFDCWFCDDPASPEGTKPEPDTAEMIVVKNVGFLALPWLSPRMS